MGLREEGNIQSKAQAWKREPQVSIHHRGKVVSGNFMDLGSVQWKVKAGCLKIGEFHFPKLLNMCSSKVYKTNEILNLSIFGRVDIIFRTHTLAYHKSQHVMVLVSLKVCFLVVEWGSKCRFPCYQACIYSKYHSYQAGHGVRTKFILLVVSCLHPLLIKVGMQV